MTLTCQGHSHSSVENQKENHLHLQPTFGGVAKPTTPIPASLRELLILPKGRLPSPPGKQGEGRDHLLPPKRRRQCHEGLFGSDANLEAVHKYYDHPVPPINGELDACSQKSDESLIMRLSMNKDKLHTDPRPFPGQDKSVDCVSAFPQEEDQESTV